MSLRLPGLGIRFQVLILVLIAVLPAAGLLLHQAELEKEDSMGHAEAQAVHLAGFLRQDQARALEGTRQLLTCLAHMPSILQRDWPRCSSILAGLKKSFPQYANLGVTDEKGMAVASAVPLEGPLDLSDRSWFLRAKQEGGFVIGDFQISRAAKKPTVNLALPVRDEAGSLQAVLVAALDLEAMNTFLSRLPMAEGTIVTLVDSSGVILSRFPEEPGLPGTKFPQKKFKSHFLTQAPKTLFEDRDFDGSERFCVTDRVLVETGKEKVFICISLPKEKVLADADELFRHSLYTVVVTLALVLMLAWILSGFFFSRRIGELARAARSFGEGDTKARSGLLHSGDELGSLARTFDRMADSITEQARQAEEAGRQISFQKTLLQCQSEASPDGIMVVSPEGSWLYKNRRFQEIWGFPDEIIGGGDANQALAWALENRIAEPARWKQQVLDMRPDSETVRHDEVLLRDGRVLAQYTAPVTDEKGHYYGRVYYHRDITREKADRERFARLVTAMDQSAEEIIMTDSAGVIEYVNPAFTLITGYEKEEAIGKTPSFLNSDKHDDQFFADLWSCISRGEIWKGRIVNRRKDGRTYIKEAAISPVRDDSGMIVNYVSVGRDVTEKDEMERSLRQAQKLEAIGTLAAGIAHDFNNILAAMVGYAELAAMDIGDRPEAGGYLAEVLRAGDRAQALVKRILLFSRQVEQEKRPVLLQPLMKEALKLLRGSLPPQIEIRTAIDPGCGPVKADPTQIHQIIMNLSANAYHAMKDQGGILSVSLDQVELSPEAAAALQLAPGSFVRISVRDTGPGIPETIKKRVFDPYFTTKKADEGTGLGLSTVHGIVTSHGGSIELESEPGKGSCFIIFLPLAEEGQDAADSEPGAEPEEKATGRILYVDDEEALVDMGERLLTSCGFTVAAFSRPQEALEVFALSPEDFDVVLSDVLMPAMNGLTLAYAIHEIRQDIPIVFCTGFTEALDPEELEAAGVVAIIMKPMLRNEIRRVLVNAMAGKKLPFSEL